MDDMTYWLPVVWAAILVVAVAAYVILDGFDLGLGILFPFYKTEEHRDVMMNTVAPFWDGNETWLVLGGVGVLVAFPMAYAIIMPAVYLPIIIMLLALIFRGVAFEFRWVAKPDHHSVWDVAFAGGSIVATFAQGVVLGGILQGITVENNAFAGGALDWLRPFPIFIGLALIAGYALLGATWLLMRTEGEVASRAREQAKALLPIVLVAMGIVSLWTPLATEHVAEVWFSWPNILYLSPVPILTAFAAWICWRSLVTGDELTPFIATIALFMLGLIGLGISNIPYLVPPSITFWQAAAPPESQIFTLVGVMIMLPLILGYTIFNYWTFRGKVRPGEGYH
ncbi:cytochrome d ubiquinol oxidase subunit II [Filomicrobium sp.]|uniref:cytochrome d ubiquinol oxidase subunit II n=1 Tax=Filomicrobium sp. TaxID=2024831 RepID=UPI00258775A1|nr:cytochrome d ubiquinol oxidase subunit II [Filomicrobium sp.]